MTGFSYDARFLDHDPGPGHPECRERLLRTRAHLGKLPWFPKLLSVGPRPVERGWLEKIHSGEYIDRARTACRKGETLLDTPDVGISPESFEAACLAAGSGLALADALTAGQIRNGFALLRPPGHHAEKGFAMGFCLFNNIAVLARYLQGRHGLEKILILDWDVHHGNGTQHTFEDDPTVLYISTHQFPFYPGTGSLWETGIGRGKGFTLNCPMRARSGNAEYETAFREKIIPKIREFKPDAFLISAGFDAHEMDPLADIRLTTDFFGWMTERAMEEADRFAKGRILSLLEGGYNLEVLPACVEAHLKVLAGRPCNPEK